MDPNGRLTMEARSFIYRGAAYPARITMGALRAFRRETGNDFLKLQSDLSGEDLAVILWASIRSQCRAEGKEFDVSLDDFLDHVTPDEVSDWYVGTGQAEPVEESSKKKKRKT